MKKSVTVIGGGVAGLSAAVFLADKDFDVKLTEASPKPGGRAYSFFDKTIGDTVDNGQHILASWYHNTFEFLKIIGSYDKLTFQKQLQVKFIDDYARVYNFKCPNLPPPLHLVGGIMGYKALGLSDKRAILRLVNAVKKQKYKDIELKLLNTDELFRSEERSTIGNTS
jgi:predicted NAD/FAD-binding protein